MRSPDGQVTDADYTTWADHYGRGVTSAPVPEPTTAALLALTALPLLRRRARRDPQTSAT